MKTLRHVQNRKYITYRNEVRGGPSHGQRQHAQKLVKLALAQIYCFFSLLSVGPLKARALGHGLVGLCLNPALIVTLLLYHNRPTPLSWRSS